MDTIRIEKGSVQMVAHRGLSGLELENTCAAFVAAGNRSYWGIETDVHRTADGKFLLIHDSTTGRVSPEDICVEENDFATLRSLPMGKGDLPLGYLQIPTLEEYLDICKRYGKLAVLELKDLPDADETVAQIVAVCKERYGLENMVFIAFRFQNLVRVKKAAPEARCQYLLHEDIDLLERTDLVEKMVALGADVDIHHRALTQKHIAYLHEKGLKVNCWTVNDPRRAKELISWGIDFITTNILE